MSTRPHGYARYSLDACRCYTCGWARAQYNDRRTNLIIQGRWQPFVDPAPARAHIAALRASGLGTRQIAAMAELNRKAIQEIANGTTSRIRPETLGGLLAVPLDAPLPDNANVDATGTNRRVRGLFALGWTFKQQGDERGWLPGNQSRLASAAQVTVATERDMVRLYDAWSMTPPADTWQAGRARKHALRQGWFLPLAWDDETIDDPAASPVLLAPVGPADPALELAVQHAAAGHPVDITPAVRTEIIRRLHGTSRTEAAMLARCHPETVTVIRRTLQEAA